MPEESAKESLQEYWIPAIAVLSIVGGSVLGYYFLPEGYQGMWPVIGAVSAFAGTGSFIFATGGHIE